MTRKDLEPLWLIAAFTGAGMLFVENAGAYAVSCNATYGENCYAVDEYYPYSSVNGVKSTMYSYNLKPPSGWFNDPVWAVLITGEQLEVGTHGDPYGMSYYWGYNAAIINRFGSPVDGSSHTFQTDNLAQNNVWNIKVDGTTYYTKTTGTPWTNNIETGYEFTYTDITLKRNDHSSKSYGRPDTGWVLWNKADASSHYSALVPSTGYYVKYCGTGDQQYYHIQHGQNSFPPTC